MDIFKQYFALKDNPFDLTKGWPNIANEQLATGLARSPILSHEEDELHKLYVVEAGPFEEHLAKYRKWMKLSSFVEGQTRGNRAYVALIAGHSGTGKTSLGSYMIRLLRKSGPGGRESWPLVETPSGKCADLQAIRALPGQIEDKAAGQKYCCIFIDDLDEKALREVCALYRDLKKKYSLHIFMTTKDLDLIDKDFSNWECPIKTYRTTGVSEDQAIALVAARVKLFRDPKLKILNDRPYYPYEEQSIRDSVKNLKPKENSQHPVTLRILGGHLNRKLEQRLSNLLDTDPDYDITKSTVKQIEAKVVNLLANGK
jgi:hypothetical protein